jgi:DNA replication regulator SLD2
MPLAAAKYKEYNKVRDYLSGKLPYPPPGPTSTTSQTPRKRKREEPRGIEVYSKRQILSQTPSKTPSKAPLQPWEVDPYDTPSHVRSLFTPSKKALGPTPQKDGVVLGLFDLLEPPTPSAAKPISTSNAENSRRTVGSTPRKSKEDIFERQKHSRTPASSSKRHFLDAFATPLKNKDLNSQTSQTPSTVSKLYFNTPSFLRRDSQRINLGPVSQEGDLGTDISPQAIRVPRKPLVRGLSSILAGLRKIEEEAHDDDLEALHEMEAEEASMGGAKSKSKPVQAAPMFKDMIQVEDSQQPHLLGGFDDEAQFDSSEEDNLGPDGQPLRVYKKKGQKRTTRRVNMKPSRPKPTTKLPTVSEEGSELSSPESPSQIPETQILDDESQRMEGRNYNSDTQSEWTESDGGTRTKRIGGSRKDKRMNKDGKVKRAARKVTAYANQNFKRLKLRNTGAKGGPGHGSRFRRKR